MYILDTDHVSILDRGGPDAQALLAKLASIHPNQVATSIITYEEQMRGWLSYVAKSRSIEQQIFAYRKLRQHLLNYRSTNVIEFDDEAGKIYKDLRTSYPRLGSMDLKIAAIAIAHPATLLTRNTKDFGQIHDLTIADWTT